MRTKKRAVYMNGTGWVSVKRTEDANYENLGEGWRFLIGFMRYYPDMIQDLLRSPEADYELTLIQRVIMRAKARYKYVDITGCRGLTKTYSSMLEELDEGVLYPRIKTAYYGPSNKQTAHIGSQAYRQIQKDYPALAEHYMVMADSSDRLDLETHNGSKFTIQAFRGDNTHKVVGEETAQEEFPRFDWDEYKTVVLPAVRSRYTILGMKDRMYIPFKQHTITSAGRRQNESYETRLRHYRMMERGESAFVMDVPFEVVLLSQIRPVSWVESLRSELTPDKWAREMESRYTGADQNPIVSDATLTEARSLMLMEEHHCCKDLHNKLSPDEVFYIIGYDVSYADGANNAKCALTVTKCVKQTQWLKRDKYLKQVVWINDWQPSDPMKQAAKVKQVWYRYCFEGHYAYIAIDSWQYGQAVVQALMMDLDDGLAPLCILDHAAYTEYELENAIPVIYPIKAGGHGTTDPDAEMIRYAEVQFENHNVELLTSNYNSGMEAYKKLHHIKDDTSDYAIYMPYKKTNELVGQIQNLKKVPAAAGVSEKRISSRIQRDSWSALKYSLRLAQILEKTYLVKQNRNSDWDKLLKQYEDGNLAQSSQSAMPVKTRMISSGRRGRLY